MKKRSTWIVFLAALLCLTMLFVSCKSNADTDDTDDIETTEPTDTTEPQETEEPEEGKVKNEDVDYDGMIAKWTQYLTYKAPEAKPEVYDMTIATDLTAEIYRMGDLGIVNETKYGYDELLGSTYSYNVYSVYNLASGEKLFSANTSASNARSKNLPVYNYAVNELAGGAFFYVVKGEIRYDAIEMRYQDPVYTYAYYNAQGDLLYTYDNLTTQADHHEVYVNDEYTYLTIEDQCFVCRDSQLVTTFAATEMRGIPEITLEYNGKFYSINDEEAWVFDEAYNELAYYAFDYAWDEFDAYVLADGNLFVQYQWTCRDDAQDYNVEDTFGNKHMVKQIIVNAEDGSVTALTPSFIVEDLINNAEENNNKVSLNGDYQLAMIHKIGEDKIASNEPTFAVLENTMAIKEELPALLKNQNELIVGHDDDTFVVAVDVYDSFASMEEVHYLYSKNGEVSLYTGTRNFHFKEIEGGFVYEDDTNEVYLLYNEDLVELMDLRYVEDYEIVDGVLFVKQKGADDTWCVVYVQNREMVSSSPIYMPFGLPSSVGTHFCVRTDDGTSEMNGIYNAHGTHLLYGDWTLSYEGTVSEGILYSTNRTELVHIGPYTSRDVTYYTYYIIK